MLLYHNRSIFTLLLSTQGGIIRFRILLLAAILASITFFLAYLIHIDSEFAPKVPHHYGSLLIGGVVSFAIVYKMNIGWQRYWGAIAQQHFMYSKWADAYSQFFSFCQVSIASAKEKGGGLGNEKKIERLNDCLDRVERNFGLLSAMSAHRLTCGNNESMKHRSEMGAAWSDQVVLQQHLKGNEDRSMPALSSYDFNLQNTNSTGRSRLTDFAYRIKELPTELETDCLSKATDRLSVVLYWILHDLAQISGDLVIAPPIQSRIYQELSNGMLGFNNSLTVADVPFPFPYANLLTWMLIVFSAILPVYIAAFTESMILAPIVSFFACVALWSVNEVAIELENLFGSGVNDIFAGDFHERFLEVLVEQRSSYATRVEAEEVMKRATKQLEADAIGRYPDYVMVSRPKYLEADTIGQDVIAVRNTDSK